MEDEKEREESKKPDDKKKGDEEAPPPPEEGEEGDEKPKEVKEPVKIEDKSDVPYELVDNQDGSYIIKFKQDEECKVSINIKYKDENG